MVLGQASFSADYEGRSLCPAHYWLKADPGFRAGRHWKQREVSVPRKSSSTPHGKREVLTPPPSGFHAPCINDSPQRNRLSSPGRNASALGRLNIVSCQLNEHAVREPGMQQLRRF